MRLKSCPFKVLGEADKASLFFIRNSEAISAINITAQIIHTKISKENKYTIYPNIKWEITELQNWCCVNFRSLKIYIKLRNYFHVFLGKDPIPPRPHPTRIVTRMPLHLIITKVIINSTVRVFKDLWTLSNYYSRRSTHHFPVI